METKNIILLAAVGTGVFLLLRNKEKKDNSNANKAIEDNSLASTQAQELYSNLNVTSTAGRFHISLTQQHPTAVQYQNLLNIALKIVSLKDVQEKFLKVTNNQYTLNQATSDAMNSDLFSLFWNYTKGVKVITTVDNARIQIITKNGNNSEVVSKQINKNIVCGALLSEDKTFYDVLNTVAITESGFLQKTLTVANKYKWSVRTADSKKISVS